MTERTLQDVEQDIREVQSTIGSTQFIVGNRWEPSVVSFMEDENIDEDAPVDEWSEKFDQTMKGERIGDIGVRVVGQGEVYLSSEDITKINLTKAVLTMGLFELTELRAERQKFKEIARKEAELNAMKIGVQ